MDTIRDYINNSDQSVALEIFLGIAICMLIYVLLYIMRMTFNKMSTGSEDSPVVLDGIVNAKYGREIRQDPNDEYAITLGRSSNESGIEYTYSLWLYIDGDTWSSFGATASPESQWKHVFHKGPKINDFTSNTPEDLSFIQSPGLWLHPNNNVMRLYVNSYDKANEYVEISNLPVRKWIHLIYTQANFVSNIYINGRLKTTNTLLTLPRQNYYNLHMTQNGGFDGYVSSFQYFNNVLSPAEIYDLTKAGPSLKDNSVTTSGGASETSVHKEASLPYLSNRWWTEDVDSVLTESGRQYREMAAAPKPH